MSRITTSQGLHVCPNCSSQLVQPVEWEPVGDEAWSVLLRCPSARSSRRACSAQPELDAYDVELDRGEALLRVAYLQLSTENMEAEIDAFAEALGPALCCPRTSDDS